MLLTRVEFFYKCSPDISRSVRKAPRIFCFNLSCTFWIHFWYYCFSLVNYQTNRALVSPSSPYRS
ncbi:hypothetical protein AG1IA_09389 [Rhizoctonia solani AG-1 IA]|uniref:Uncharacterized protein n=1 Tax=Thanatephorus cucumeris (strain AG1-IA) TaxID=983506 RepID=L8WJN5_THACA|nr:hypothetical protein AG1IA_09389 [Rhizoctonia solani AG-1 IA]